MGSDQGDRSDYAAGLNAQTRGYHAGMARQSTQGRLQPRHTPLLAALPEAEFQALAPALEPLALAPGMALYESGEAPPYLYFPASGSVSLLYLLEDGSTTEIALTGREGVVGISLFMGGGVTPSRAVVQIAGHAWRLRAAAMRQSLDRGGSLLALERLDAAEIAMTQERIAQLLGVRREGVTEAAGRLQEAGAIEYSRGRIRVLERAGLEQRACECYAAVRTEYERLLPAPPVMPATAGSRREGRS